MSEIKFGTDGWRAVVGKDFNEENVIKVTNAIGKYVFDEYGIGKKIIIGYDPRNMADVFSEKCAEILAGKGFSVYYSERIIPTPVLAFCAKRPSIFLSSLSIVSPSRRHSGNSDKKLIN